VSRVLNGKPGVSASTRDAVLTALDVLGYERPTKLRGERARLVGLVMPELQNPIFPALAEAIGGGLAQNGYTPVLCIQTAGGISESDYVELLLHQQVSGVIFAGGAYAQADVNHDHYARLVELKLPTVLVNAPIDGLGFATVSCDDVTSMEQAFGHLVQLGHERIGILLGPRDHMPSRRKHAAAVRMAAASASSWATTGSCTRCTRWSPARPPPRSSSRQASRASCAPATRWRSARSAPCGGQASVCPRTCR